MDTSTHQQAQNDEMSRKRPRLDDSAFQIPVLGSAALDESSIEEAYLHCQAVHIPKISTSIKDNELIWQDLTSVFESLDEKDKESWCIENGGNEVSPMDFLLAKHRTGYSSFLIQHDTKVLQETLARLPIKALVKEWSYGHCLWCFFGVNFTNEDLPGRPEHTDSVSHDGTWHYQLSGTKRWYLRPTEELVEKCPNATSVMVDCKEGDVLVVNTRLWWHCTVIPPQSTPSVSYARDFYRESPTATEAQIDAMKNVDGLYAANTIEEGTILFTEDDMPDCALPHSATSSNCKVVELDDGSSALVSTRIINAGEFFCVAEDSDTDEEDGDDGEEHSEDSDSDDGGES